MDKEKQLNKFGFTIKKRRNALKLSVRELSSDSGVSAALISKLENGMMKNFPKQITIELLSKSLKFENNELFTLANILFDKKEQKNKENNKSWQEKLRTLLATTTKLSPENIEQSIFFIQGLEILQDIEANTQNRL